MTEHEIRKNKNQLKYLNRIKINFKIFQKSRKYINKIQITSSIIVMYHMRPQNLNHQNKSILTILVRKPVL